MDAIRQRPPRRSTLTLWGLLEVGAVLLCVATVTGFLARLWWIFELSSHFRVHLAVCLAVLAVVWAAKRHWRLVTVCGLCAAVNTFLVLSLLWPPDREPASRSGTPLRLATINVHTANERSDLVLEFLRSAEADVILLMEVNERWMDALSPLSTTHPILIAAPREDNFGIALFSRIPLTNGVLVELGSAGVPSISANLNFGGQDVFLLGTHPLPPGSGEYARLRNEQLRKIAAQTQNRTAPVIVLGDLNATPWSPYFADLLRNSGLKNTSQGRGLFGTWPASLPFMRIPLDHCLVSPSVLVINKWIGPRVGGDHLPVVVDLQLPADDWSVSPH